MDNQVQEPKYPLHTLSKALEILDFMQKHASEGGITLNQISNTLQISKSSAHRILDTLLHYGFVEKTGSAIVRYQLSWAIYRIGKSVSECHTFESSEYKKIADKLAEDLQCGVCISRKENNTSTVLYNTSPHRSDTASHSWSFFVERLPLYATASGKLFMLDLNREEILTYFQTTDIKRYTPNTILNYIDFLENLEEIKAQGYAVEDREFDENGLYIAMPVKDYTGKTVAAISVTDAIDRTNSDRAEFILPKLAAACDALSAYLGYEANP